MSRRFRVAAAALFVGLTIATIWAFPSPVWDWLAFLWWSAYGARTLRDHRGKPVSWPLIGFWFALYLSSEIELELHNAHRWRALLLLSLGVYIILALTHLGLWRRLGRKLLASSGLTSINAQSFRRQAKESA